MNIIESILAILRAALISTAFNVTSLRKVRALSISAPCSICTEHTYPYSTVRMHGNMILQRHAVQPGRVVRSCQ